MQRIKITSLLLQLYSLFDYYESVNMTDEIEQTLEWIAVKDSTDIANIHENFTTFDELSQLTDSDIRDLVENFRRRTLTDGKYAIPLTIQKRLQFTIDWLLDFERVNRFPTLVGLDQDSFRSALKEAGERGTIIKKHKD